jgi:hypothetical protein
MKHPLRKPALAFFRKITALQVALDKMTGLGKRPDDVWPFGHSRENTPDQCYLRKDGLWQSKDLLRTGNTQPEYRCIFLWRIHPNYCTAGRPICTSDKVQTFLENSETEKILITEGDFEFVWMWDTIKYPTKNVWGMNMGPTFYVLRRKSTKEILVKEDYKNRFLNQIEYVEV